VIVVCGKGVSNEVCEDMEGIVAMTAVSGPKPYTQVSWVRTALPNGLVPEGRWIQAERLTESSRGQRPRCTPYPYDRDPEGVVLTRSARATPSGSRWWVVTCPGAALRSAPGYFRRPFQGRPDRCPATAVGSIGFCPAGRRTKSTGVLTPGIQALRRESRQRQGMGQ